MADNSLQEGQQHKQKGWEHFCTVVVLLAEFLAVKYSQVWLAWCASLFLWFAVRNYARHYLGRRYARIGILASIPLIVWGTYILTREPKPPNVASGGQPQSQSQNPPVFLPQPESPLSGAKSPKATKGKNKNYGSVSRASLHEALPPAPAKPSQDNSVHIGSGATIDQTTNGDCSPNIIGASNTVTCGPPQRSFTAQQGGAFHESLVASPPQHKLIIWARGGEESIKFMKQMNSFVPALWSAKLMDDNNLVDSNNGMEIWAHPDSAGAKADAVLLQNALGKAGVSVPIITNSHQDNWKDSAWLVIFATKR